MTEELSAVAARVAVAARYLDDFSPCGPEIEADAPFPAASVIKVGIMSSLLHQVAQGLARLDDRLVISARQMVAGAGVLFELEPERDYSLAELCRLMMVVSDNTASNALVRHQGMDFLNRFWAERGYDSVLRRHFMEPVTEGRDNSMTAMGAAKMLRDLYLGDALSPTLREFAIGCLRRQQYREKIPLMLPETLTIGNKTGELDGIRHDAAVVETDRPYILVVLTAQGREPWVVDQAIARYSLCLYQKLSKVPA